MPEQHKKTTTIYSIIIAVLLFLLVLETGILISKSDKPVRHTENKLAAAQTKIEPPAAHADPQPTQPAATIAYDPFTPSPYLRRIQKPRTQTDPLSSTTDMDDPFYAMEKIQQRMNSLFDSAMLNAQLSAPNLMNNSQNGIAALSLEPPVDIEDDGKNYIIKSDMPGLEKDKINITVEGKNLSITGTRENVTETKDAATGYVSQERSYGSFSGTRLRP